MKRSSESAQGQVEKEQIENRQTEKRQTLSKARGAARRRAFAAIAVALGWGLAELLAIFGWWGLEGELFTPGRWAQLRQAATSSAGVVGESPPGEAPGQGDGGPVAAGEGAFARGTSSEPGSDSEARTLAAAVQVDERTVLHPYLGFVFDPVINQDPARQNAHLEISPQGFFQRRGSERKPVPERGEEAGDEAVVGIFGGSVAMVMGFAGEAELLSLLARHPSLEGRPLRVVNYGLGGYKQPQALLTLAYRLSQGERFDLVILVDGFNEIALPPVHNVGAGVATEYPRHWEARVAGQPTPDRLGRLAALTAARQRRGSLAESFDVRPLRWSAVAALAWRGLDGAAARRVESRRQELAALEPAARGFQATGPVADEALPGGEALYQALASDWANASLAMHHLAAGHGAEFHHFLQPNQYVPGSKPLTAAERRRAFRPQHPYRDPVRLGYPLLRQRGEALRRSGVRFTDLSMLFETVDEPIYVDTCCHLNGFGNQLLARAVGEAVIATSERKEE
ncbi:MAG: hypothetical protein AAGD01_09800 [Acidobacteriota bacterium]